MSKKAFTIQFTPEAIRQIERIAGWYEEQLPGLGNRFKRMLKAELIKVKQNPLSRSVRYNNVHFAVPYRFPYAAHYTVGGNKIPFMLFSASVKPLTNGKSPYSKFFPFPAVNF